MNIDILLGRTYTLKLDEDAMLQLLTILKKVYQYNKRPGFFKALEIDAQDETFIISLITSLPQEEQPDDNDSEVRSYRNNNLLNVDK
jgi:hypothetical protein